MISPLRLPRPRRTCTERFANLAGITPRVLLIGVNEGSGNRTHTLTVKRGGKAEALHLTEGVLQDALQRVREQLTKATYDAGGGPRFPEAPATSERRAEFDDVIAQLAYAGHKLYNAVWTRVSCNFQKEALNAVRDRADDVIQIVHYDQNYLFPWSALYDFPTPPELKAKVCHEFTQKNGDGSIYSCQQCLGNCVHPDKEKAFCVYGFWGQRHQIEQVLHTPFKQEDAITGLKPVRDGAVLVAVGLTGGIAATLAADLAKELGQQWVREVTQSEDVLTELWSDARRPIILLLVGHYETRDLPGQPPGPRLILPGQKWLQADQIIDRAQKEKRKWTPPNPIVVIAACKTTAADLRTLVDFLGAFADSRAAAVVGTETVIFEGLARRFGKEIATAIFKGETLGGAVVGFRRRLLQEDNPLGFVLTPYGDADLTRGSAPEAGPANRAAPNP
jgi:hypothetical protein